MKQNLKFNLNDIVISGKILASALKLAIFLSKPGITPYEIDSKIKDFILSYNGSPSFLGLDGYPFTCCYSVNEQVVHGIPSKKVLKRQDIVTVDIGVSYNGHCTDAARTFVIGECKNLKISKMIATAYDALNDGISQARPYNTVGDISFSVQKRIFNNKYTTTLEYGGHGIGLRPHMDPFIPNYGQRKRGPKLISGMCLAIEPILIDGPNNVVQSEEDGWTIYSPGGYMSAHVEDTVIVADTPIILTRTTLDGDTI